MRGGCNTLITDFLLDLLTGIPMIDDTPFVASENGEHTPGTA